MTRKGGGERGHTQNEKWFQMGSMFVRPVLLIVPGYFYQAVIGIHQLKILLFNIWKPYDEGEQYQKLEMNYPYIQHVLYYYRSLMFT